MDGALPVIFGLIGFVAGAFMTANLIRVDQKARYSSVGIAHIYQNRTVVNGVESNWYEIVWKDGYGPKVKAQDRN